LRDGHLTRLLALLTKQTAMSAPEDTNEPELSSQALRDLLADSTYGRQIASCAVPPSATRSSPALRSSIPGPLLPRRLSSQNSRAVSEIDPTANASSPQNPSLFSNPGRSIFSSGPATSSVSANTAHASMSNPHSAGASRPLATLTASIPSPLRRQAPQQSDIPSVLPARSRLTNVEKDVDDPSGTMERSSIGEAGRNSTQTTLHTLFAIPDPGAPSASRQASYYRTISGTSYPRRMYIS
jgi:hypothetical protein